MMIATLRYSLPDDQGDFDAALAGRRTLSILWEIDQHCRSLLKHGDPSEEERKLAEQIRGMIPQEFLEM